MDVLSDRKLGKKHSKPLHLLYSFSMTKSYQTKKDYKKKKKLKEEKSLAFQGHYQWAELTSARTHPRALIT